MKDNAELASLGLDISEMVAFWDDKTQREANDKTDSNRQNIKDAYNQAMLDLQTILDFLNPTNAQVIWAVKRIAEIERKELLYHKIELGV